MKLKPILSECWTGYKQVGMKNKGGRQVPNCVPESVTESSKEDIIKDLDKAKNDLLKKVDVLIAKKKKLYSDVDIESPMSADEKKLDKDIADLFSDINKLVLQKRSLKESELKGYLAADVVDDIVKAIGSKMVKGYVENAPNRNYIYLKLTDIKFGNDVVKMLKSKFGIDAKVDKTFGNIPTVSFSSNKVISEAQAVSGGKVHKLITGKNLKFKGKSYNQIDFETLGVDNNNGTIRLRIIAPKEIFGNEMSLDFRTIRRGPFFKTDTNNQFSESKTYKKGDKLKIKLPNGKKFDVVFVDYSRTKGVALGKFKDGSGEYDTKPFSLDSIVESVNEAIRNTPAKTGKELADFVLRWYDFDTNYIDDGGQRRRAIKSNEDISEWFDSHPIDLKKDAFKIIKSKMGSSNSSELQRVFGKSVSDK